MVKYNGSNFTTFTTKDGLSNNDVWEAFTTPDGKIWYFSKASSLGYIKNDRVVSFPNSTKGEIINPTYSFQLGNEIYPKGNNKLYQLKNDTWSVMYIVDDLKKAKDSNKFDYTKIVHENVNYLKINSEKEKFGIYDQDKKKLKEIDIGEM